MISLHISSSNLLTIGEPIVQPIEVIAPSYFSVPHYSLLERSSMNILSKYCCDVLSIKNSTSPSLLFPFLSILQHLYSKTLSFHTNPPSAIIMPCLIYLKWPSQSIYFVSSCVFNKGFGQEKNRGERTPNQLWKNRKSQGNNGQGIVNMSLILFTGAHPSVTSVICPLNAHSRFPM